MGKRKYQISKRFPAEVEAIVDIEYHKNYDGICVTAGSLPGSGFQPYHMPGITIPEEIDGITVTELRLNYPYGRGYIEAFGVKRIALFISDTAQKSMRCSAPVLCGGVQNTLESMQLIFSATELHLDGFSSDRVTRIVFNGRVLDDPDWDYGSYNDGLFKGCRQLREVIGCFEGWYLGSGCFEDCSLLESVPSLKVKRMGDNIFKNCGSLAKVHLSNGLKSIGSRSFENCIKLEDVYIPDTVESIGVGLFCGCTSLKSVHMPNGITELGYEFFRDCIKLSKIYLPNTIMKIGACAFENCSNLQSPWIPNGLKEIGERAFAGCKSIREIWIPDSVISIGEDAFDQCTALTIKGKRGSLAEKYANDNGFSFVPD